MISIKKILAWLERYYSLIIALLCFGIISLTLWYVATTYVTVDALFSRRDGIAAWAQNNIITSSLSYMIIYFCVTSLALPIAPLFTMAGGLMFGVPLALLYTVISSTAAATMVFWIVRKYARPWVVRKYDGKLEEFNRNYAEHGKWFLLIARLIPLFPFFLVTVAAALTHISTRAFTLITLVGMIPVTYFYATAGSRLMHVSKMTDFVDKSLVFSFSAFIFIFAGAGLLLRSYKKK